MPITTLFSPQKNALQKLPEMRDAGELKQLRVFGISDRAHRDALEDFLNETDINCMGILNPVTEGKTMDEIVSKVAAMPIDALVLMSSDLEDGLQAFMAKYSNSRHGVASILITDTEINVRLLQDAMLCGINHVMCSAELTREKVCSVLRSEVKKNLSRSETTEVMTYSSRVILTYSCKGGAGKTTVAVNLAAALSQRGKKVTIMDLDLASGDIRSFLGISNTESIAELAAEPEPITPATIKSYVHPAPCNIGVICAPSAPQHASAVKPALISKVITTLRAENDYVIVDCDQQLVDGSIAQCNEEAMHAADLILFIVTPEVPTIRSAYDMLNKYLNRFQGIPEKIRLLVNKSGSASTITPSEIANTLGKPLFASIPDDYGTVVQTLNAGIPLMSKTGLDKTPAFLRRPIIKAYNQLTDKVIEVC